MSRSLLKFFKETGGPGTPHGQPLIWPGTTEGFPVRGVNGPVALKQHETENIPIAMDYHARRFRLWNPEEAADFNSVMDHIVNGLYMQHKRFDNYVPEEQDYVVRLEWVQIYGELSPQQGPRGNACHPA